MHELGIVFHVIDRLEELAEENGVSRISKVTLEIGEVSGVVHEYLTDCWAWAVNGSRVRSDVLRGSELVIEPLPAVTVCNSCGKTYPTVSHGRICPFCRSEDTVLVSGNEMSIKEMEAC